MNVCESCCKFLSCRRGVLILITLAAWGMFVASIIAEHVFNLLPCSMCMYQRYMHFAIGALGLMIYHIPHRVSVLIVSMAFLGSAGLAGYHVGIEHGVFPAPKSCGQAMKADSIEELRAKLLNRPTVRCDKPAWTLGGISMAGYNFLASLGLAALGFLSYRRQKFSLSQEEKSKCWTQLRK